MKYVLIGYTHYKQVEILNYLILDIKTYRNQFTFPCKPDTNGLILQLAYMFESITLSSRKRMNHLRVHIRLPC